MKKALLYLLFLAAVCLLVQAALPPSSLSPDSPQEQGTKDGKKKKSVGLGEMPAFHAPPGSVLTESVDPLPSLDAQTVAVVQEASQDAANLISSDSATTIATDSAATATNAATSAPGADESDAVTQTDSESIMADQAAAAPAAFSANEARAMPMARQRAAGKPPQPAKPPQRTPTQTQPQRSDSKTKSAETKPSGALSLLRPSFLASVAKAGARSGIISGTKNALKEFPMVLRGDVRGYGKKVAKNAAIGAAYGAMFRVAMEKFPPAKQVFVFGNIAYKAGSVCIERGWVRCIDATLTQLAKYASITAMGAVLSPISQKHRGVVGFVGSAIVFGVGSFVIDYVFDAVEQWFDDSPSQPLPPHKVEL